MNKYLQFTIYLSPSSFESSKCLLQHKTASSNRPITFKVFPKFPEDLASPNLSPIVLKINQNIFNSLFMFMESVNRYLTL